MNKFFFDNLNISKLNLVMRVESDSQSVHIKRANHGIIFQTKGSTKYVFKQNEVTIKEGDIFYLPKFSDYKVIKNDVSKCIAINFEITPQDVTYPFFFVRSTQNEKYLPKFQKILTIWNLKNSGYLNCCMSILYDIIYCIQQDIIPKYLQSKTKKIAISSASYISSHLSEETLTINNISEINGITPEYFRKIFESVYGISPKKYIILKRIEKSKELLLSGEFKITKISELCGFDNVGYFCKTFKEITGNTPTEFKKQ